MGIQHNQVTTSIQTIAVVDDDKIAAEATSWAVEDAGFRSFIVEGSFSEVAKLADVIKQNAQGALCDNRLAPYGLANFVGASLVAALCDSGFPAILLTQYIDIDKDVSIREWRHKIPVLLSRDELNAPAIMDGIRQCSAELRGEVSSPRKPYRTLIRIVDLASESGQAVVDAIVPSWNPCRAVRFPTSLVPSELRTQLAKEMWLFAHVNIGAVDSADLYFDQFESAPEPDDNDGLS